jgi:hypothetical protein
VIANLKRSPVTGDVRERRKWRYLKGIRDSAPDECRPANRRGGRFAILHLEL